MELSVFFFYKSCRCILTGYHTIGIVSGSEDYDALKASCKDLLAEINEPVDEGEIEVDGDKVPLPIISKNVF